jgi:SAM-dependent methyltransferase
MVGLRLWQIKRRMTRTVARVIHPCVTRVLAGEGIIFNPHISAKFFPLQGNQPYYTRSYPDSGPQMAPDGLPIPPEELWEGWGPTAEDYLASGREDTASMLNILKRGGASPEQIFRVLDFGCGAGRMLRFYPCTPGQSEVWGVDIKAKHILWCQQYLSPPFYFATTTTMPHLPFEDNYFDLVYCGSVFTHISDMADAWFLELRRILRKGGHAYITIHDQNSINIILGEYKDRPDHQPIIRTLRDLDRKTSILSQNYAYFSVLTEPKTQVFYDVNYLVKKWSRYATLVSINPRAMDYQTALIWQK